MTSQRFAVRIVYGDHDRNPAGEENRELSRAELVNLIAAHTIVNKRRADTIGETELHYAFSGGAIDPYTDIYVKPL